MGWRGILILIMIMIGMVITIGRSVLGGGILVEVGIGSLGRMIGGRAIRRGC